jgi:glyoxylase-like metal-dependent hydrolase (beta-lactamase superfamily II)
MHKSILKNLWQVGGDRLTASSDAAIYLIRCGEQAALVDAGCGGAHEDLVANINGCLQDNGQHDASVADALSF